MINLKSVGQTRAMVTLDGHRSALASGTKRELSELSGDKPHHRTDMNLSDKKHTSKASPYTEQYRKRAAVGSRKGSKHESGEEDPRHDSKTRNKPKISKSSSSGQFKKEPFKIKPMYDREDNVYDSDSLAADKNLGKYSRFPKMLPEIPETNESNVGTNRKEL